MSNNIYSNSIFIGREEEIKAFVRMLSVEEQREWILHLIGPGGIGKTKLLEHFIEMVQKEQIAGRSILVADQLIDLYWTVNQQEIGLLKNIAEQLDKDKFVPFLKTVQIYEQILSHPAGPSPELIREKLSRARAEFFTAYSNLEAEYIFLFFDTAEIGGEAVARFWSETLPQLKEQHLGTRVVIAGRQKLSQLDPKYTYFLPVKTFSSQEVQIFFEEHKLDIEQHMADKITFLSEGRPVLIALAVDWLAYGFTPEKLVDCATPQDFEHLMIRRVQELHTPEDKVITAMAHFYRRFDERFLAYILNKSRGEAQDLIEAVAEFSFVKYRPPLAGQPGSCLLHDEMRDLVNRYVWPELDPGGSYRQEDWDSRIVSYYADLIQVESNALEKQALQLERLFYWLSADLEQAFAYSQELFAEARKRRDISLMEAINREFAHVENRLTPAMQNELAFRQALILHGHGHFREAVDVLASLSKKSEMSLLLRAAVGVELIESYVYGGELPEAVAQGQEWEKWFAEILKKPLNDEEKQHIEFEFGKLCNNLGLAFRHQNKLQTTIEYYEQAQNHFSQAGENAYAELANTRNNLGFVYHRLGRDDEALSVCNSALEIRKRLRSPEQLGYSYNVRAIIFVDQLRETEARSNFQMAAEEFRKAGSRRGQGLLNIAYGRALRQLGRHIERNAQGEFDPNRLEYLEAGRMLQEAVAVFRQLEDEANLSEALNEYGTLLRQLQQWDEAIAYFTKSRDLAEKVNNFYRVVDNLVDIAITYDYQDKDSEKALAYAVEARTMSLDEKSGLQAYNLYAKAQEVIANILFKQGLYDDERTFKAIADACIYLWRLDPQKLGESPAKRELYYNQMVHWAGDKILQLPSQALVDEKTAYLIRRWQEEKQGAEKLADKYPGFIIRMRDLARDYQFLKMNPVEE